MEPHHPADQSWEQLLQGLDNDESRSLARLISRVENETPGYEEFLQSLDIPLDSRVIGITGPPGAGKSTLIDRLIAAYVLDEKKTAVVCIDPSSPFHAGSLLGDRIRMSEWYTNPRVFIRSLATRGTLGGLHPKIIAVIDLLRVAGFERILIETAGVGQNEVEIAAFADTTVLMLVPESGDEIQVMKSGILEVADILVVNKSDRPDAGMLARSLGSRIMEREKEQGIEIALLQTVATENKGIAELKEKLESYGSRIDLDRRSLLLAEQAYRLIAEKRCRQISKTQIRQQIRESLQQKDFNLYRFADSY